MEKSVRAPRFADSHAHLNNPDFAADVHDLAARLADYLILNAAYDIPSARGAIALAERYPNMYASAGVHPNDVEKITEADYESIAALARHTRVAAIGETGLDYFRHRSGADAQKAALRRHLKIAREAGKPVIIHCRDAFADMLPILAEEFDPAIGGVMHCFSEGPKEAEASVKLGMYVSFAGNATYPKAQNLRDAAKVVPAEKLLIETDCPYLAPQAMRGKRNDPTCIIETAKVLAEVRGVTLEDLARVTRMNFQKLYLKQAPESAEIVYKIRNALYVNVTRECCNLCDFCPRIENPTVQGHYLGIDKDPSAAEIIAAVGGQRPDEVVLCGFGEPTIRLDVVKEVAAEMKRRGLKVRLNTNGQGSLVNKRDIVPELAGLVDAVSISLNAPDQVTYNRICHPADAANAFPALLAFIVRCRDLLPETVVSAVGPVAGVDMDAVRRLAEETLCVKFRLRRLDLVG